ncbi:MAG TPA: hypothetical protein VG846_11090 [Actinomycetota bacterium]|nr:hypothetical protein [Actinomycetota bacterium]
MHSVMLEQLAADRVAELRADAQRARHEHGRRARRASEAGQSLARRQWRVLVQGLMAR